MRSIPPVVVRTWLPALLFTGAYLFFHDRPPAFWLIPSPLLLVLIFMNTLAEIQVSGEVVRIRRWWGSMEVNKGSVARIGPCLLDDIGVVKLRKFVLPWGCIYFVRQWSDGDALLAEAIKGRKQRGG